MSILAKYTLIQDKKKLFKSFLEFEQIKYCC